MKNDSMNNNVYTRKIVHSEFTNIDKYNIGHDQKYETLFFSSMSTANV